MSSEDVDRVWMGEPHPETAVESPRHASAVRLTKLLTFMVCGGWIGTLFATFHWIPDLLANLRLQQIVLALITIVLSCVLRRWRIAWLLVICLALHLPSILRWEVFPSSDSTSQSSIRVMTVNVLTENNDFDAISSHILASKADVVAVLELAKPLADHLAETIGEAYPHAVLDLEEFGNFGIAIYSQHPFDSVNRFDVIGTITTLDVECRDVRIFATHPLPPVSQGNFHARNEQLSAVATRIARVRTEEPDAPIILMGDFNLTPWSPHYTQLESVSGLSRGSGMDLRPTWYAGPAIFPFGLALDHVLISPNLSCIDYVVGPDIGSDHRSVTVEARY